MLVFWGRLITTCSTVTDTRLNKKCFLDVDDDASLALPSSIRHQDQWWLMVVIFTRVAFPGQSTSWEMPLKPFLFKSLTLVFHHWPFGHASDNLWMITVCIPQKTYSSGLSGTPTQLLTAPSCRWQFLMPGSSADTFWGKGFLATALGTASPDRKKTHKGQKCDFIIRCDSLCIYTKNRSCQYTQDVTGFTEAGHRHRPATFPKSQKSDESLLSQFLSCLHDFPCIQEAGRPPPVTHDSSIIHRGPWGGPI